MYENLEIFKDIPNYEGIYKMSNNGNVKSFHKKKIGMILKPSKNNGGYLHVNLFKNKTGKHFDIHRLVAITWIPNPHNYPEVHHKNYNKLDNRVENLEWLTAKQHRANAIKNGRHFNFSIINHDGENNGRAKLKNNDISEIRQLYKNHKLTQTKLGKKFGVSQAQIGLIVNNKSWKHLNENQK